MYNQAEEDSRWLERDKQPLPVNKERRSESAHKRAGLVFKVTTTARPRLQHPVLCHTRPVPERTHVCAGCSDAWLVPQRKPWGGWGREVSTSVVSGCPACARVHVWAEEGAPSHPAVLTEVRDEACVNSSVSARRERGLKQPSRASSKQSDNAGKMCRISEELQQSKQPFPITAG